MAKKIVSFLFLLGFVAFIAGCSALQQTGGGDGESYFPSAVGNSWLMTSSDGESTIMTVEGTVTIGSVTAKRFFSTSFSTYGTYTSESYYRVDSTGVYAHGGPSSNYSTGIPVISFPLEVGKSWGVIGGTYSTKGNVLAKENVTVPAGTFDSYKIKITQYIGTVESYSTIVWLGNNAGIVKTTSSDSTFEAVLQWKNF